MLKILETMICVSLFSVAILSAEGMKYELKDLGTNEFSSSEAIDINDQGQVLGICEKGTFLWDPTKGLSILDFPRDPNQIIVPLKINNLGQVIGDILFVNGISEEEGDVVYNHPFFWDPQNGFQDLGSIKRNETFAVGIDDEGNVLICDSDECYLVEKGKKRKIEHIYLDEYCELLMSGSGQICTGKSFREKYIRVGSLRANFCKNLDYFDCFSGIPFFLNNKGVVVGYDFTRRCGFAWDSQNNTFDFLENFFPRRINDYFVMIGRTLDKSPEEVIYDLDAGFKSNINEVINLKGSDWLRIEFLVAINNLGQIIGTGIKKNGDMEEEHAFILMPIIHETNLENGR